MSQPDRALALKRLGKALDAVSTLKGVQRHSPEFEKWHRDTRVALANTFGEDSSHVQEFKRISFAPITYVGEYVTYDDQLDYISDLPEAAAILLSMIEEVQEYWQDQETVTQETRVPPSTRKVFIVHGRDTGTKDEVARFLEKLHLEPIVLAEGPSEGRTIIEKFETYSEVGFAIVLLTADDSGALKGEDPQPRARQNVIFELGFFVGKLGRKRVCALTTGSPEIPSDYAGVVYIPLDSGGSWKMPLIREIKAAGIDVDANKVFD